MTHQDSKNVQHIIVWRPNEHFYRSLQRIIKLNWFYLRNFTVLTLCFWTLYIVFDEYLTQTNLTHLLPLLDFYLNHSFTYQFLALLRKLSSARSSSTCFPCVLKQSQSKTYWTPQLSLKVKTTLSQLQFDNDIDNTLLLSVLASLCIKMNRTFSLLWLLYKNYYSYPNLCNEVRVKAKCFMSIDL